MHGGVADEYPKWIGAPDLVWAHFDDAPDWVVFHPRSGDVFLLTEPAYQLWQLVAQGPPQPLGRLLDDLATRIGHDPRDPEFVELTRQTVAFMDRAGLIYPAAA